ncbi:1-deoxy-D-xylulose-5-phosphate reductoisomerase [Carboxydothermus ferrireducens]|uniref:1-deoxy-D-xylulose 5-phosphate reductoisomerase n=1 Tax=Carboxydothermus ferrireducens DSM 11255 TaxID=1119529 RepID=A0ABX2RF67_9THEO|nr:1-deoxy-D-xylulose-5-phosphate reductoisomerase [Carboxydothermus ferrireducens]NYE58527.1 1-deoxy-D-xylulose-5-phosphate reductoisomerase [Carboxydothermus ferrireducens DSM 11255]
MKRIVILGSTGSIGRQSLEVIEFFPDKFSVVALAAAKNGKLLLEQCLRFKVKHAFLADEESYKTYYREFKNHGILLTTGSKELLNLALLPGVDGIITAIPGTICLLPTIEALKAGKIIYLANKETMVAAGEIITPLMKLGENLLPVDSEHSAIFQALQGEKLAWVKKLLITASGGPFREYTLEQLKNVTVAEALKHPRWKMGNKITIDSATLMNKGLEIIEAHFLFQIPYEKIEPVIHPQSVIHSLVEFYDGSVLAQLGLPDMRYPIQYALTYPERFPNNLPGLNLTEIGVLSFEKPDYERFPALKLAIQAGKAGNIYPAVLNAANEIAVEAFLAGKIKFLEIAQIVEKVLNCFSPVKMDLETILEVDFRARELARKFIGGEHQ